MLITAFIGTSDEVMNEAYKAVKEWAGREAEITNAYKVSDLDILKIINQ